MELLINATTLGNLIIVTGSVILLYVLIRKYAWEQITGIFEAREQKIASDIEGAERSLAQAEELKEKREQQLAHAREEAGQIVETARHTSQSEGDKIISEARLEAGRQIEQAKQNIEQSKAEAVASVKGEVADLTVLLAEKIMATHLDAQAQSELIDSYLDKLGEA